MLVAFWELICADETSGFACVTGEILFADPEFPAGAVDADCEVVESPVLTATVVVEVPEESGARLRFLDMATITL